ncbi:MULTISPECIES: nickel efflux RND transporter outer membrane subunit CnrC [Cupriavidus]|uniref:Nickel and cobalt resistance protein CnrC n=1 Tax=Cupriavidus metallidurans (strain ATCC 43123 / DSM 2839 / NBRC 102507 / CH34) TaxID=266264 RepID=CNRC_CUPMC|nr:MULTISPECIES: nickel efflux RND transporter outer membrane subunit CnrC [Cupriavidus]P37974.2 RecName: Full=Nickel and cobalt resistance protein CnrC; Flags: Precursor [Cupriavidus metallidurans CH34]HBD37288.1 nickel and cobalt resistance protein CnrC [Cupriavidus sp.]AAA21968.1 cnrC [Cupriavidus metallidurans CH34]ABF13067.1 CnrC,Outer membrane protein, three components cation proton antiporter efflux system, involved in Co(II), Ni(II) resistance [Cupriavidus metallidurans CH34]MBY4732223
MKQVISSFLCRPRFVGSAIWLLPVALSHAAEAPPFPNLLQQSLALAPAMVAQAANVRAAGADAAQAQAWLNPRIDTVLENLGAPSSDGLSQRQNTYSITQPFELGGKRGARIEVGERNFAAAQARERQAQVAYAAELAVAYATAEAALGRKILATENLARANEELAAARALVDSGKEASLRSAQAKASVAAAQAAEAAATNDATQALARLSAMSGASEPYTAVTSSLLTTQAVVPNAPAALAESPSVRAAEAERNALDAQVDVERKRWIPDVGVSAGVRRYGWTNSSGYVVGVTASIPLFDQNRNGINAAVERVAAAQARLDSVRLEANVARQSAISQVATADKQLAAASEGEQAAAEAYRMGRIGYESGKTPLMELLAVRRALVDARQLTIDARLARVRALAALAQADGRLAFEESR